jgi:hypothetical protein
MQPVPPEPAAASRLTSAAVIAWSLLVLAAFVAVARWEHRPGAWTPPPQAWPASSPLARSTNELTLLVFVHPHCPCTRASLDELERIVARTQHRLAATVIFCAPEGAAPDWVRSDSWQRAHAIPSVSVFADANGLEARRFGARTSGATLLFDRDGRLVYRGGITGSRGHAGDNAGESAVLALVDGREAQASEPVYGCALFDSEPGYDAENRP